MTAINSRDARTEAGNQISAEVCFELKRVRATPEAQLHADEQLLALPESHPRAGGAQ